MEDSKSTSPGTSADTRAAEVFREWLLRRDEGEAESLDELLQENLELQTQISSLSVRHDQCAELVASAEGRTLGEFRIIREIGRGGMGIVYEAEQLSLRRSVAIKILPAQLTFNERALARFQKEASVTARMHHRGIIDIHAISEHDGVYFIAMELVEGSSLAAVIDRMRGEEFEDIAEKKLRDVVEMEPLRATIGHDSSTQNRPGSQGSTSATDKNYIESVAKLVIQVADALQHAHDAGVVHRDVKPANILLRRDGSAVLTDFGLAREQGLPGITQTGEFAGTPHYVSPEQAMAHRVPSDHRTDIFSLGATLYELLTLERAFDGETAHEVLAKIISKEPVPPQKLNPALHPDLVTIVLKALDKDQDRRYQSAAEFAEDLRALLSFRPIKGRRTPTVVRALRWARREPMKAALGVTLTVGLPLVAWLTVERLTQARVIEATTTKLLPVEIASMIESGFQDLATRKYEAATSAFGEALELDEESIAARCGMALSWIGRRKPEEALEVLGDTAQSDALPLPVVRIMASAEDLLGNHTNAQILANSVQERVDEQPRDDLDLFLEATELLGSFPLDVVSVVRVGLAEGDRVAGRTLKADSDEYREAERALTCMKRAIAIATGEPRKIYYCAWVWAAVATGDEQEARDAAFALESNWGNDSIALWYAGVAAESFDREKAQRIYELALEGNPADKEAQLRIELIRGAREASAMDLEFLREYAESAPESAGIHANLAAAYYGDGDYPAAIEHALKALELDPELSVAWDTLGTARDAINDLSGAIDAFEKGLEVDPDSYEMLCDLGYVLQKTESHRHALEFLDRAHEVRPGRPRPLRAAARSATALADHDLAADYLDRALELDPENVETLATAANSYYFAGEHAQALEYVTRELELRFDEARIGDFVSAFEISGAAAEQLALSEYFVAAEPENPAAHNALAWFHANPYSRSELQVPELALEHAQLAVELSGEEASHGIVDTLAMAHLAVGDHARAIEAEQWAIELYHALPDGDPAKRDGDLPAMEQHLAELRQLAGEALAQPVAD